MKVVFFFVFNLFVFNCAISQNHTKAIKFYNQALEKYKQNDFKGAIIANTQAINLDSNYSEAYNDRGISKAQLKDYVGAIEDFSF